MSDEPNEPNAEFSGVAHGTWTMPEEPPDEDQIARARATREEPQAKEQEGHDDA